MKYLDKSKVKYIVVHCSATLPGQKCDAKDINLWHIAKGWEMIGYHYVILPNGIVEHGRPLFYQGAHVKGYNDCSIGVCYVGGLNSEGVTADTRTDAQTRAMYDLLHLLKLKFPGAKIVGHRDLDKGKACPCFDAKYYNYIV